MNRMEQLMRKTLFVMGAMLDLTLALSWCLCWTAG
jgi:hypothetical protein